MAKKAVATFAGDRNTRKFVKCIKMERSSKTGAYVFKEDLVPAEETKSYFSK